MVGRLITSQDLALYIEAALMLLVRNGACRVHEPLIFNSSLKILCT